MPFPLFTSVPPPETMLRPVAVKAEPSTSLAFASSCACVMRRAPLSSAIAASVTGVVTGASFTLVTVTAMFWVSIFTPSLTFTCTS